MSKTVIIPASTWFELTRQLNEISNAIQANDLVGREEACKILNISSKTLTNYLALGKITPDTINELDQMFFSRARLVGLKKKETA